MKKVLLIAYDVLKIAWHEKWLWGLLILSLLFLAMVNTVFLIKQPILKDLSDIDAAKQIGMMFINLFCMIIAILISLGILREYLREEKLLLFFSKPLSARQLFWGILSGLSLIIFCVWFLMVLFLDATIFIHKHYLPPEIIAGLLPALVIGFICISLALFFYNFYPNGMSSLFSFLIIIASFGVSFSSGVDSPIQGIWRKIIYWESFLIPKINQLIGLGMCWLGVFDIKINPAGVITHSLLFLVLINWISAIIFQSKIRKF